MKKQLMAVATSTWLGLCAMTGLAVAQTAASSPQNSAMGSRSDARAMMKKAGADYNAAKAACRSMKRVEAKACLKDAKAAYQQAKVDIRVTTSAANAGGTAMPQSPVTAVETQSSAVSATGIAPSPGGPDLTPGKPAVPGK